MNRNKNENKNKNKKKDFERGTYMKKFLRLFALLLLFTVAFSMVACGGNKKPTDEPASSAEPASSQEPASSEEPASSQEPASSVEPASSQEPASSEEPSSEEPSSEVSEESSSQEGDGDAFNGKAVYNYRQDFQGEEQGKDGWSYLVYYEGETIEMESSWSDVIQQYFWTGPVDGMFPFFTSSDFHTAPEYQACCRFVIPYSGEWECELFFQVISTESNGIGYTVYLNGSVLVDRTVVQNADGEVAPSFPAMQYQKGDVLDLVLDANGSHVNDSTYFDVTLRCPAYIED